MISIVNQFLLDLHYIINYEQKRNFFYVILILKPGSV